MRQDSPVDGFRLAYERTGAGPGAPAVMLLHGWPGDRADYRKVTPLLSAAADVIVPDLRGFGESDKLAADPARLAGMGAAVVALLARAPFLVVIVAAAGTAAALRALGVG